MKTLIGSVRILNRVTGAPETAEVYRELDGTNFDDIERLWKPPLDAARNASSSWAASAAKDAQDAHWEWEPKARAAVRSLARETFAVECNGETQGLMLVDVTQFGRLNGQQRQELVYIDLLATAPWNRPKLVLSPRYKGVGRVMLATAIAYSEDLGFNGRIGLHSLPQSVVWYSAAGLTDGGHDQVKDMRYFEMTEQQAATFIAKMRNGS